MLIVSDDKIPFIRGVFEPYADVLHLPGKDIDAECVKNADAIVTRTRTICDRQLLEGSKVRIIASATIGYDHIDTRWCEENGIVWRNAPGCNSGSVAQYIASALVSLARRHKLNLDRATLGVIGVGHVGSKVVKVGEALGMKVLQCDPPRARKEGPDAFVSLDTVIAESDIISLHTPLSTEGPDATYHLFDSARIAAMKPTQILINSSRGPVVDNAALKDALKARKLKGAILDVWEGEPSIDKELLRLLDFGTPHIAGYSADGKANGTTAAVRAVAGELGLPLEGFTVGNLPSPACGTLEFRLDACRESDFLAETILRTYDIASDSMKLAANPDCFEKQRGDYPVRREPEAFTIRLKKPSGTAESSLRLLGFNIM